MALGSSIIVEKGGVLVLENSTLYNPCGGQWLGIEIHPEGRLHCLGTYNMIKDVN